jgi:hypothetical protein
MGAEIGHAKQVVLSFVQSEENTLTLCFVLVAFNDYGHPGWPNLGNLEFGKIYDASYHSNVAGSSPSFTVNGGAVTVYGINNLLSDINTLYAHGGGDCPEYANVGILKALQLIDGIDKPEVQTEGRHNVIVLTDASAKDDSLWQTVINTATASNKPDATIHFFYSGGGCGGVGFGHFEDIKSATGGYSVGQINAGAFQLFVEFINFSNSLKKRKRSSGNCQVRPISHFISRFSSLLETSSSTISITKPDGSVQNINTVANSFAIYKVQSPQAGTWRACVSSGSLTWNINSIIEIDLTVDYLKEGPSGDLLPTSQLSYACDTHNFVSTSSKISKISLSQPLYLDIVNNEGSILQTAALSNCDEILTGSVTLPYGLVQYQLRGQDISMTSFSHIIPNSYVAFDTPSISVSFIGDITKAVLNRGVKSLVRLSVLNNKNGPQALQITGSAISTPSGVVGEFVSNVVVLRPKMATELQMLITPSTVLSVGQNLQWSFTITDACTGNSQSVPVSGIIKHPVPTTMTEKGKYFIQFQWSQPDALSDVVEYSLNMDFNNGTTYTVAVDNQTFQYNLVGLHPYQFVYFVVSATSSSGETAEIPPFLVITHQSEPGQVSQLRSKANSQKEVGIFWDVPKRPNGILLSYELSVRDGSLIIYNKTFDPSVFSAVVQNLQPYRRYTAMVRAATSVGKGEQANYEFYSAENVPVSPPKYYGHTVSSPTSFKLQWLPPPVEDRKGFITEYTVYVESTNGTKIYKTAGDNPVVDVTDMPVFGRVNVSFKARTRIGEGPVSLPEDFYIVTGVPSPPVNVTTTALSDSSFRVQWETPEFINGEIFYYLLYYQVVSDDDQRTEEEFQEQVIEVPLENNNTIDIEELISGAPYTIKVAAVNYGGHGENATDILLYLPPHPTIIIFPTLILLVIIISSTILCIVLVLVVRRQKLKYKVDEDEEDLIDDDRKRIAKGIVEERVDYYETLEVEQKETKKMTLID